MKRKIFITLILTILSVLMLGALSVSAETYGDLTYTVSGNDVTITDCSSTATSVTIPSEIAGKSVTTIANYAFSDCTGLTSVTIPDSVTMIGEYAFRYCTGLASITIPDSVATIGNYVFANCDGLTSITIPDSVTTIGNSAFIYCTGLTRVNISSIEAWCNIDFNDYYSNPLCYAKKLYLNGYLVTDLVIPDSVTTIRDYVFYNCNGIKSVTIPDSVTTIGDYAFEGCTGLTSVTIPDSVTLIGNSAFYGCTGLTSVTIPDSVTTIGNYVFANCDGLTSITIPDSVTSIGENSFYNCDGLTSITIPDSVTKMGFNAFYGCVGLTRVNITSIDAWVNIKFYGGDSNPLYYAKKLYINGDLVTDLVIPDGVTTIGNCTFFNCTSLTSIIIPDSVTTIGSEAFRDCTRLISVTIPDSVEKIGSSAFQDCDGIISITIPNGVKTIGRYTFYGCTSLTSVMIPDSVTTIGSSAFYGCTSLTSITIPDSVTTIEERGFYNCKYLTSIVIPNSVTEIGKSAFYNCMRITSIEIGSGVNLIPENAFYNCTKLTTVCLPSSLLYIRNDAFNGCSNLTTVFYAGDESKWNEILFYNRNENLTNAKIIYNAIQKTYSFVTNCDEELNDITGYAVFSSPVINNEGSTLVGWYDNEELSGNPVAFPYYGDNITLYASWTEKTGASFDDALIIRANREYTVTTTSSGQLVYFEFVPKKTKEYKFYSTGSKDTYGYLYNSSKKQLTYNDDAGDGNNFLISYKLTKGETYYIAAKVYNGTGTFTVVAEEPVDYIINSLIVKDSSGNEVSYIPQGSFSVTVSFTNVSSNDDAVIVLARYNSKGTYKGLMNVTVEDVPAGATMKLTLPVDNINGDVAKIKAFCWASVGSVIPVGNSVTFPAQ